MNSGTPRGRKCDPHTEANGGSRCSQGRTGPEPRASDAAHPHDCSTTRRLWPSAAGTRLSLRKRTKCLSGSACTLSLGPRWRPVERVPTTWTAPRFWSISPQPQLAPEPRVGDVRAPPQPVFPDRTFHQDLGDLRVAGTEGTVQLEAVGVVQKGAPQGEQHLLDRMRESRSAHAGTPTGCGGSSPWPDPPLGQQQPPSPSLSLCADSLGPPSEHAQVNRPGAGRQLWPPRQRQHRWHCWPGRGFETAHQGESVFTGNMVGAWGQAGTKFFHWFHTAESANTPEFKNVFPWS